MANTNRTAAETYVELQRMGYVFGVELVKTGMRYCGPCDRFVPKREKECKKCGADTERVE